MADARTISTTTVLDLCFGTITAPQSGTEPNPNLNFTIQPLQSSSPIQTNKASSTTPLLPSHDLSKQPETSQHPTHNKPSPTTSPPTLVEKIRLSENKTLRRLALVTIAPSGRPRVLIHDSVFQKEPELHKDFIICYFNGKAPHFNQIQSVFNHMWGKGKRLEIHNNPLNHSAIVRIQSEYLRQKILEKNIWYVGDSMFHTAQWSFAHSKATPPLKAIQI